ncbi:MAG: hypothetical protein ABIZ91_00135 [Gemmatimonadaceae bacterium]
MTVQIEHAVKNYEAWQATFDRDPARREQSGVRRYRVNRPVEDPLCVIVELDFDARAEADAFITVMRGLWPKVEGTLIEGPRVRVLECMAEHEY